MKQKSKLLKTLGIMLLFVLFATQANAQNITVTGTVSDNLGPVIGASIQVEGTSNGCITDIDGNYSLPNVPSNATLVFSYIGYQTQKVAVAGKTKINVKLRALVTGHVPVREIAQDITKELIMEKLAVFHRSLKEDFGIDSPRIAVFSLNPHAGDEGLIGTEESDIIIPAMKEMVAKGIQCFGPYPADGFMGSGNYTHFDGILAMYHDQGLAPFKALAMDEGVNYTAGLPIVRTSPAHGTAYDIAGQGVALEDSFRQAIYVAMDVFRNRVVEKEIHAHPLRKQYYEKRDDSDKLKLDTIDDED